MGAVAKLDFLFDVLLGRAVFVVVAFAVDADAEGRDRVVVGDGVGSGAGGEARRFVAPFGLPTLFFAAAGAGVGSGSDSSGTGAVLALFDPRVNRNSPSCS